MKKFILVSSIISLFVGSIAFSGSSTVIELIKFYKSRYKVECANQKITDNHGDGFNSLYGTRNMRPILHGIAYRGGANNVYNKNEKRDNHNPLPQEGLDNLAKEGFSTAIYLYATNFKELFSEKNNFEVTSKDKLANGAKSNSLSYLQISGNSDKEKRRIFSLIVDIANGKIKGPIYLHCWNGWHQSGYISSVILRQFCDITAEQAFDYWMQNTDKVNKGYENVKAKVKEFKPIPGYSLPEDVKKEACPCLNSNS